MPVTTYSIGHENSPTVPPAAKRKFLPILRATRTLDRPTLYRRNRSIRRKYFQYFVLRVYSEKWKGGRFMPILRTAKFISLYSNLRRLSWCSHTHLASSKGSINTRQYPRNLFSIAPINKYIAIYTKNF
jgi:hypothetical protein